MEKNSLLRKLKGEWVQALVAVISGIIWVDKHCYDWSMVSKATIDQLQVTLLNPNDPRNRCAPGVGNKWEIYADTRV